MSEPEVIIGIDLGTTNSEVAILVDGSPTVVLENDEAILPSCVGIDEAGQIMVGSRARNQAVIAPERTVLSVKRLMGSDQRVRMGDEEYLPQEISAFILKALKERAQRKLGRPVDKAVITVPAYFTDSQRQATREAGEIAGLTVTRIINEPTAASLVYEHESEGQRKILVYDLGGGTFDVSVVAVESGVVEVLASTGDNRLGGDDFDETIVERLNCYIEAELDLTEIRGNVSLQARLRRAAERAKITLSQDAFADIEEDHIGSVGGEARHLSKQLSRFDFESDIEDMLGRTMESVTKALNDAQVKPEELDRVLLVGGSTRIPRITELLRERLGLEPHSEIDPDLCVALGAGIQAGIEMGLDMQAVLVDVTPYTFGTRAVGYIDGQYSEYRFFPLIRRNAKLPTTHTKVFSTLYPDQKKVQFSVYQGEDEFALNNVEIGSFMLDGLNEVPEAYDEGILLTYNLDIDGLLKIHAKERLTGKEIRAVVENVIGRFSSEEIGHARDRVGRLWGDEPVVERDDAPEEAGADSSTRDILSRVEGVLPDIAEEDREELTALVRALGTAVAAGDSEAAAESRQSIEDILFYLE